MEVMKVIPQNRTRRILHSLVLLMKWSRSKREMNSAFPLLDNRSVWYVVDTGSISATRQMMIYAVWNARLSFCREFNVLRKQKTTAIKMFLNLAAEVSQ
ncbi:hypothetical protein LINPERHAP1_LOCUS36715 [Linum perenne]